MGVNLIVRACSVLLGLALFLTVCASLRPIEGVGFGEMLLLGFAIIGWYGGERGILVRNPFAWFWGGLAILMCMGFAFGHLPGNWVKRDALAYGYTGFVSLGLLLLIRSWTTEQLWTTLRTVLMLSVPILWFGFLVFLSGDVDWIRAVRITDLGDSRYAGWTTNANQLALFFVPLPIWILLLKPRKSGMRCWVGRGILLLGTMLMGLIVRSDALALSWGIGLLLLMGLDWLWGNRKEFRLLVLLAVLAVGALLVTKVFTSGDVRKTFQCSFHSVVQLESPVANGCVARNAFSGIEGLRTGYASPSYKTEIRLGLWRNALRVIKASPWVGHGPGAFSWYADSAYQAAEEGNGKYREEAHNIPLDLMTQGGVFLGLAWIALLGWLLVGAWRVRSAYAFTWVFMLGFFTLFMYHLRHPYLWFCLILASEFIRRRLGVIPEKLDKSV